MKLYDKNLKYIFIDKKILNVSPSVPMNLYYTITIIL